MTKRILIAEDSLEWQKYHAFLLKGYKNHEVEFLIASSAKEALDIVMENHKTPFDLILSDLQMETDYLPELAGEWLVQRIKEFKEYTGGKIVLVSAAYNIGFISSKLGVDYLAKRNLVNNPDTYFYMLDEHLK